MRILPILLGFLLIGPCQLHVSAEVLYTWTDDIGTIHITTDVPPQGAQTKEKHFYNLQSRPHPKDKEIESSQFKDSLLFQTVNRANLERKKGLEARRVALAAIEKANRMKNETDEFLQPWRGNRRLRSNIILQIEKRIQATNQAIEWAEELIRVANEAEKKARSAEAEAIAIQKQFVDQYRIITSQ